MAERRNPYLILGIDYGSSAEEAAAAFARVTRRLRREEAAPFSIEDATWSLHQIEQAEEDPSVNFRVLRVPADPGAYMDQRVGGVLDPQPENLGRTTVRDGAGLGELRADVIAELAPLLVFQRTTTGILPSPRPRR